MPTISSTKDRLQEHATAQGQLTLSPNENVADGMMDLLIETAISNQKNNFRPHKGWETHSSWFNQVFGGISNICTIAGTPGSGKSSVARSLCIDFLNANPDNKVLYLSAEDRKTDFKQLVISRLINFNRSLWFKKLNNHDTTQFPLYLAGKIKQIYTDSTQEEKILFKEYYQIIKRYENKTKGDGVFKSKENFISAVAAAMFKNNLGDNSINELLVVIDHLGEFDLTGREEDYVRTNEVLELVMSMTGLEEGEYVTDFKTMCETDPDLSTILNQVYENLEEYNKLNGNNLTKEEIKTRINFPKIKFIIISQLKSDANQNSGKNQIRPWFWTEGSLAGSKKVGEKALQVIFLWNMEGFDNRIGAMPEEIQKDVQINGSYKMGMMKIAKNREGASYKVLPYFINFTTGDFQIPPCPDLINPTQYEDWLKSHDLHPQQECDKLNSMLRYRQNILSDRTLERWNKQFNENSQKQKRFRKLFQIDQLINYI